MKITGKIIISVALMFFFSADCWSQNRSFAQSVIDTLCSADYFGRGYLKNGDEKAAKYIRSQFKSIGLDPLCPEYFHPFGMNVNTFPETPVLQTGDRRLLAGIDFIPFPGSGGVDRSNQKVIWVDEAYLSSKRKYRKLLRKGKRNAVIVLDTLPSGSLMKDRKSEILKKSDGRFVIEIVQKLTWSVSMTVSGPSGFQVLPGRIQPDEKLTANVRPEYKRNYVSRNVAGYIKGSEQPDSFIVFTAHYDHLGGMGDSIYFPGANDNASGIGMMLDMASEFAKTGSRYSVAFIAFGGEEAGLVGSYHWVKKGRSWLPLDKIRFLINMDLMGSGEDGIMAVNGAVFEEEYKLLQNLNTEGNYLKEVKARGKAANSDHYFFTEAGVRAFFFYLMGPYKHYHDVYDNAENLKLMDRYDSAFRLMVAFAAGMMK